MGRFEKISEKIMPYKIKSIISNTFADIMIINCGKYFEVQRINYKHETIFKKEVKKEIVELVLLSTNYMVLAIYEDNKYEIINIDKSEIIYSSSFEKVNITKSQGNIFEFVSPYKSTSFIQDDDNNTIEYSIPSLNINSFSKFDVSKISFFESIERKTKNNFYIMDKKNSVIYISQNVINPICEIKLLNNKNENENKIIEEDEIDYSNYSLVSMFPFLNNSIIYITQEKSNELFYHFNYINPPSILNYTIHDSLFKLYYSLYIIDYIKDILNLTEKLVTKTKIFLFDKYIDNNNLTFKVDSTNEKKYQSQLKNDLKNNIFFGELSLRLSNMFKKDLFEEGSLNKLDDKIHFNLKNIESIIIGNLKPALNRIEVYLKENYFRNEKLNIDKDNNFINIFSSIEFLLNDLIEISSEYRNFIAWLNSMASQYINGEKSGNQIQNKKNGLDKIYIENDSIINFVKEEKYNMNSIATFFEEKKENNDINSNLNENLNIINYSSIDSNNNIFSKKFLAKNNISFKSILNQQNQKIIETGKNKKEKDNLNEKFIFPKLDSMKSLIKEELSSNYLLLSKESQNLPQDFLNLSGITEEIKKFYVTCNESNEYIIYFTSKEKDNTILYIIAINMNSQCKLAKINFSYKMDIKIIDFKISLKNELLLLVKTPMKTSENDEEMKEFKFTLISSDLSNYIFYDVKNEKGVGDKLYINLQNYEGIEDIKIDELADVECNDNSFLELTGKGFITLVDNSLNKIIIIDLIQDK
jgi:hypothetical protein